MWHSAKPFAILLAALLLAACSSTPGQETSAEASGQKPASDTASPEEQQAVAAAFDPIRCERYTPSGTRISQKICKKQSEWDRLRAEAQRALQDVQTRSVHENQTQD